jgi:uncharacterized protein with NRDE domain
MCLLVIAWRMHPVYRLVVAANRDEFHARPTAPMAKWPPPDDILAGRDLRARGTWLGLDRRRRFGVITNFRDLQPSRPQAPSRGQLIPRYLSGALDAGDFLTALEPEAAAYAGFNLLLADSESLWYASNRAGAAGAGDARALAPGIYGLSNRFLDTPWPKLRRVRHRFEAWIKLGAQATPDQLFDILNDRTTVAVDADLPQTGLSAEWERVLSAPFVLNPEYGTRCSTVLLLQSSGAFELTERRFDPGGDLSGESHWALESGAWP